MTHVTDPDPLAAARVLFPVIEAARDRLEAERRLPDELVRALAAAGIFRIAVPRSLGGLEVDAVTMLEVIEALSWADGAVGWVAAIGAGTAAEVTGALRQEVAFEIYGRDPLVVTCGTLAIPGGRAIAVPGGYRVSGRWPFGSGSLHADWFASNCIVVDGDMPRLTESGQPETCIVVCPKSDVDVLDTWHVAGLRGTGSNDYTITDRFIPEERTISRGTPPTQPGPLYAADFFLLTHAAHALGIARRAIAALSELAGAKQAGGPQRLLRDRPMVQADVAQAEALVGMARAYLMEVTRELWATVTSGGTLSPTQRARARLAMTAGVRNAAAAVDLMYEAGGGSSVYETTPLERCFRDIHVATQHAAVGRAMYESVGQVLLGLPPRVPFAF